MELKFEFWSKKSYLCSVKRKLQINNISYGY